MKNIITVIVVFFLVLNVSVVTASASCKGFSECSAMAQKGDAEAQSNLGVMYYKGQGVLQDYKEAVKLFRLAANQGYALAQSKIGGMYTLGRGVPKNYIYAYMWINISASNGDEDAIKMRDLIVKEMTAAQISKAQQMARKCIKSNYKKCD